MQLEIPDNNKNQETTPNRILSGFKQKKRHPAHYGRDAFLCKIDYL